MRVRLSEKLAVDVANLVYNEDLLLESILSGTETSSSLASRINSLLERIRSKNRLRQYDFTVADDLFTIVMDVPLHASVAFMISPLSQLAETITVKLQAGSTSASLVPVKDYSTFMGVETGLTRLFTLFQQKYEAERAETNESVWAEELSARQSDLQDTIDTILASSPVDWLAPISAVAKHMGQVWVQNDYLPPALTFIAPRVSLSDIPATIKGVAINASEYIDRAAAKIADINDLTGALTQQEIDDAIAEWKLSARAGETLGATGQWYRLPLFTHNVKYNHAGVIDVITNHLPQMLSMFHELFNATKRYRPWSSVADTTSQIARVVATMGREIPLILLGGIDGLPAFLETLNFPWKYWALLQLNVTNAYLGESDLMMRAIDEAPTVDQALLESWQGSWTAPTLPSDPVDPGTKLQAAYDLVAALQLEDEPTKTAYSSAFLQLRDAMAVLLLASYGKILSHDLNTMEFSLTPDESVGALMPYAVLKRAVIYQKL